MKVPNHVMQWVREIKAPDMRPSGVAVCNTDIIQHLILLGLDIVGGCVLKEQFICLSNATAPVDIYGVDTLPRAHYHLHGIRIKDLWALSTKKAVEESLNLWIGHGANPLLSFSDAAVIALLAAHHWYKS